MAPKLKAGALYAGIDLGGTKILAIIASAKGECMGTASAPTPAQSPPDNVIGALAKAVRDAAKAAGTTVEDLQAAGVAAAGAIDGERGLIVHSPHLPSFKDTPVVKMLQSVLGLPVVIGNDANLAALGEHQFGAGKGVSDLLYITISTGIGGGIIAGNKLFLGAGGYAGEVGHITVDAHGPYGKSTTPGAWESLSSGSALARIVTERVRAGASGPLADVINKGGEVSAVDVFTAYHAGDALARAVVHEGIEYSGTALASLVNVLNPAMIIIGGGLANEWNAYIAPAVEIMRKQSFADIGAKVPVVPPALGVNSGALGAAALAMEAGAVNGYERSRPL